MYEVHYCEFSRQNNDRDIIYRPNGSGDWLFLLFLAPMRVTFPDHDELAEAGSCLFYSPDAYQNYHAVGSFRNSYIHFSSGDSSPAEYGVPRNQVFYPSSPDMLNHQIQLIQEEYLSHDLYSSEMTDLLLRRLLITAARLTDKSHPAENSLRAQFQQARLTILSQCEEDWDIQRMCGLVNLGKSQFYSCYREFFGRSPKEELLAARIDRAQNLLTNEAMQVQQAAALCGFKSICHFTRYFRSVCGCTPGEYQQRSVKR